MYKISVIVPIYNVEKYLDKCLQSIIGQTYKNLEIILIDDGSSDKSSKICEKYKVTDNRIIVIHKKNEGLVRARKTGINLATGDYISFIDADDYVDIDTYECLIDKIDGMPDMILYNLVEEYFDYCVEKYNKFKEGVYSKREIMTDIFPQMISYGDFFDFGILPNLVCKLISKSFLQNIHFEVDDTITVGEDVALTYQLMVNASRIQLVDIAPYHYCKRNDSMMWQRINPDSLKKLNQNLMDCFSDVKSIDILRKQLDRYILFVSLLKCPEMVDNISDFFCDNRIALYGAGGFGQALYGSFSGKISLWVDENYERYKDSGMDIYSIDELINRKEEFDKVFISILNTKICEDVMKKLDAMGVNKTVTYFNLC